MSQMKTKLQSSASAFGRKMNPRNACIGLVGFMAANSAFAAIDTTEVVASVGQAEADGITVGQAVIATVAALVVVTIIIGVVKKI